MNIQIKKLHPDAVIPNKAHESDAGYDITAIDDGVVDDAGFVQYRTGISVRPDEGYHLEVFPRSSISKYDLSLANSIGLIDNGYRGEILLRFKLATRAVKGPMSSDVFASQYSPYKLYVKGDKIGQIVVRKTVHADFQLLEELDVTSRSVGGFGSTGR
jgi:dUTP pyrophosphatase